MRITKKMLNQWEREILAGARLGATMNEADPLGVLLQKKVAEFLRGTQ